MLTSENSAGYIYFKFSKISWGKISEIHKDYFKERNAKNREDYKKGKKICRNK